MNSFFPLISVIVPVYNVQDYVERCVRSLMKQTYQNLEIILINDGSTDSSLVICEKLKAEDVRIKLVSQANQGIGSVRNLGLSMAQGAYLAFVDSDDWIDSDMYESLWKLMAERQADIVCCAHCREEEKPLSGRGKTDSCSRWRYGYSGIFTKRCLRSLKTGTVYLEFLMG